MPIKNNSPKPKNYIIAFFLLCISGNPVFIYSTEWYSIMAVAFMSVLTFFNGKSLLNNRVLFWLVGLSFLFVLQGIFLSEISVPANVNFLSKIYAGFLMVSFIGRDFRQTYFKVIYWLAIISLLFWTYSIITNSFFGFDFDRYRTIIVYNTIVRQGGFFVDNVSFRNSGMFWEPGAFQGYLMLAFLLYINDLKYLWIKHRKECIILLLAMISTQSTTGYIALAALLIFYTLTSRINILLKIALLTLLGIGVLYAYNSLDFLGEKISDEYMAALDLNQGQVSWSRMGALIIDIQNISRHPILGNGFLLSSRYKGLGTDMAGTGNGLSGAINMLGIVCILMYFICLYNSTQMMEKKYKIMLIILLIILLNGEYFLNYSLFWSLLFVFPLLNKQRCFE